MRNLATRATRAVASVEPPTTRRHRSPVALMLTDVDENRAPPRPRHAGGDDTKVLNAAMMSGRPCSSQTSTSVGSSQHDAHYHSTVDICPDDPASSPRVALSEEAVGDQAQSVLRLQPSQPRSMTHSLAGARCSSPRPSSPHALRSLPLALPPPFKRERRAPWRASAESVRHPTNRKDTSPTGPFPGIGQWRVGDR